MDLFLEVVKNPKEVKVLHFGKNAVRELIGLFSDGNGRLKREQVEKWRNLIIYAVDSMRSTYESSEPLTPSNEAYLMNVRKYYSCDWIEINKANKNNDIEALCRALQGLCTSIAYQ